MKGTSPDSELEVKAVQRTLLSKLGQWDSYITLHSYGQYFFTPWGFTTNLPNDYYDLTAKARVAVNAIRSVDESDFEIGSSANLLCNYFTEIFISIKIFINFLFIFLKRFFIG